MARITVTLEDESLAAAVCQEAARRQTTPSDLVTQAVREWLEGQEDAEWLPIIEAARQEWKEKGGVEDTEFFRQLSGENA